MKKILIILMLTYGCNNIPNDGFTIKEKIIVKDCDCEFKIINDYGFTLSIFDYCDKWGDKDTLYSNQDGCTEYVCRLHPDENTFCFK